MVIQLFSTKVTKLIKVKSTGIPSRIIVRSEDGAIRIMSPLSGKVLTTSLPLLETDKLKDITYSPRIGKKLIFELSFLLFNKCIYIHTLRENVSLIRKRRNLGDWYKL
jgi:hypothetical protein